MAKIHNDFMVVKESQGERLLQKDVVDWDYIGKIFDGHISPVGAINVSRHAWDYRSELAPKESVASYTKFAAWIGLGKGRTLTAIAIQFGVQVASVCHSSKRHNWKHRLAAWEEYQALRSLEEEREARHNEHLEKLKAFRERSEALGTGLITAGAQLLKAANESIGEMRSRGEVLDRRLVSGALNASAKVAEAGRVLMAQSLGVDALIAGIDGADGDGDEYS